MILLFHFMLKIDLILSLPSFIYIYFQSSFLRFLHLTVFCLNVKMNVEEYFFK